ncbi:hypothetical protein [Sphaerotilus sp.]|uniref:hypothetical protein n=1 Tax=Sphaerotilus sp. TaxID=2093942 RepID=UPI00286DA370|nr:hypothetical protein [Sphaerotilus sp.]
MSDDTPCADPMDRDTLVALASRAIAACDCKLNACAGLVLRYEEVGGYYVDIRARRVDPAQVVDPAP